LHPDSLKRGLGEVLQLSWPASLSMLNRTLMQFLDGLMLTRIGAEVVSAQTVASLTALVPESFATGSLTVVNTYVSQNLGAGRPYRCGQYAWAGLWLALAYSCLVAPLALFASPLLALYGHTPIEQRLESMYFAYMVASIFLTLPARVLEQFFYGVGRPRIVLVASVIANAFNLLANYALIFGKFGFPALGLEGSAVGTVCAWGLQLAILLSGFLRPSMHRRYATGSPLAAGARQMGEILRIGYPTGLQFCNDVLPWTVFLAVMVGHFGETHRVASTAAMRYLPLSFMPAVGIGVAATALVGKYIGQGRPGLSVKRAHAALGLAMTYMGLCGLAFWVFRYPLVRLFIETLPTSHLTPQQTLEAIHVGAVVMICAAVFQMFDALGIVYIGALRGAGDTFWPMVATAGLSWAFTVGGGYLMIRFWPELTSIGPWMAASAYVVVLGVAMAWRFEGGAWRKIDLLGRSRTRASGAATASGKSIDPPARDDTISQA
jgi:MATE family multidrug resistance protein